ncbi:hypothetical protein HDG40_000014 [Paraburkholderia sp. JPY158]|uniref:Capsule polysaccharide biosynthesis protein n=1 Tax=Paraburkholderia atlantica TaxID=2654982 RepID=A0A7W8Q175_PARAM|nr:hypothetical protein [Paraburkholderia atlantica]MBB5421873.1 hypothetical protein [Paraburkholderia atlantica]
MTSIKRIVVTGDFLRLNADGNASQNINIKWLYHLVRPALQRVGTLPIDLLISTDDEQCFARQYYEVNGLPRTLKSWVKLFNSRANTRALAAIHDRLHDSLVVAFELPEVIRAALERLEIPYVDFTVHPARFLDDLLFGVRSNVPGLGKALGEFVVFDEEISLSAGLAMATLAKLPNIAQVAGYENVALFAGQTIDDKVLIRDGKLLGSSEFLDQFHTLCQSHSKVLVKPHPYAKNNPIIVALTRLFHNTELIHNNFYHLLAQDPITHVYSITSSTSIEAAYFDKRGVHLAVYPYAFSDHNASGGHYLTISPAFFLPQFWGKVLQQMALPTRSFMPVELRAERSRMRKSMRNFWGADIFETI